LNYITATKIDGFSQQSRICIQELHGCLPQKEAKDLRKRVEKAAAALTAYVQ
jgi:hypothetical protein